MGYAKLKVIGMKRREQRKNYSFLKYWFICEFTLISNTTKSNSIRITIYIGFSQVTMKLGSFWHAKAKTQRKTVGISKSMVQTAGNWRENNNNNKKRCTFSSSGFCANQITKEPTAFLKTKKNVLRYKCKWRMKSIERNQYKHGVLVSGCTHTHTHTHKLFYPCLVWGPTQPLPPFLPPNPIVHIACWDIGTSGYAAGVAKGEMWQPIALWFTEFSCGSSDCYSNDCVRAVARGGLRDGTTDHRIVDKIRQRSGVDIVGGYYVMIVYS